MEGLVAGEESTLLLHARDQYGNNLTVESWAPNGVGLLLYGSDDSLVNISISSGAFMNGTVVTATKAVTRSDSYEVLIEGFHVSPPSLLTVCGAEVNKTLSSLALREHVIAGEPFGTTFILRDSYGNLYDHFCGQRSAPRFQLWMRNDSEAALAPLTGSLHRESSGTYSVNETARVADVYSLQISSGDLDWLVAENITVSPGSYSG